MLYHTTKHQTLQISYCQVSGGSRPFHPGAKAGVKGSVQGAVMLRTIGPYTSASPFKNQGHFCYKLSVLQC